MILKVVIPNINRKLEGANIIIANVEKHVLLDKKCSQIHGIECGYKSRLC